MPKTSKKRTKKQAKSDKSKKQATLFANSHKDHAILRLNQPSLMLEKLICLTDDIYGDNPPQDVAGHHFIYKVVAYNSEKKKFWANFQLRMIEENGHEWKVLDGEHEPLDDLTHDHVKDGFELYNRALGRINAHEFEKTAVAKAVLEKKSAGPKSVLTEADVDMSDLEAAAVLDTKNGWKSQLVLDVSIYLRIGLTISIPF